MTNIILQTIIHSSYLTSFLKQDISRVVVAGSENYW